MLDKIQFITYIWFITYRKTQFMKYSNIRFINETIVESRSIPPLFPIGCATKKSPVAQANVKFSQDQVSCKKRKSYRRAVLHRAATTAHSLPPGNENTLRSLAATAVAAAAAAVKAVSSSPPDKSSVK